MRVFLDDERPAPEGWSLVRWPEQVIALLQTGQVDAISLDHDLGDDEHGTGYTVVLWIEEAVATRAFKPPQITVHSANVSARAKMLAGIARIEQMAAKQQLEFLIVDHLVTRRRIYRALLKEIGCAGMIAKACDAEGACELLVDRTFNVLIIENTLPRVDGIELTRRIQSMTVNSPRILLTGIAPERIEEARNAGVLDIMPWPHSAGLLHQYLCEIGVLSKDEALG